MQFTLSDTLLAGWIVLVIDDEPDSLFVAQTLLEMCGATVITAPNGDAGLAAAKAQPPSFILTDLSMPEINGWDMLNHLRQDTSTRDIPVIALTAHAMAGDRERAVSQGFHNYLAKPLHPETFVSDVLNLLLDVPVISEQLQKTGVNQA